MDYYKNYKITPLQLYILEQIHKTFDTYEIYGLLNTYCILDIPGDISEINVLTDEADERILQLLYIFYNDKVLSNHQIKRSFPLQDMMYTFDLHSVNSNKIRLKISKQFFKKEHITAASFSVNNKNEIKCLIKNTNTTHIMNNITSKHIQVQNDLAQIIKDHGPYFYRYTCFCLHKDAAQLLRLGWSCNKELIDMLELHNDQCKIEPNEKCAICQEKVSIINSCSKLKCNHIFHFNCLEDQIAEIGARNCNCCLCNREIFPMVPAHNLLTN